MSSRRLAMKYDGKHNKRVDISIVYNIVCFGFGVFFFSGLKKKGIKFC